MIWVALCHLSVQFLVGSVLLWSDRGREREREDHDFCELTEKGLEGNGRQLGVLEHWAGYPGLPSVASSPLLSSCLGLPGTHLENESKRSCFTNSRPQTGT